MNLGPVFMQNEALIQQRVTHKARKHNCWLKKKSGAKDMTPNSHNVCDPGKVFLTVLGKLVQVSVFVCKNEIVGCIFRMKAFVQSFWCNNAQA